MKRPTVTKRVLTALTRHERISQRDAYDRWGTTRLASIVHNLRRAGYDIHTTLHDGQNGARYAVYHLASPH
jgi:hypothetical protein